MHGLAILLAVLLSACVAVAPPPAPLPPLVTATPTAAPTRHALLAPLEERDRAHTAGDVTRTLALVDPTAPAPYRAREEALAKVIGRSGQSPPRRALVRSEIANGLATVVVSELDDQGRERLVRYFLTQPTPLLTEPTAAALGEEQRLEFHGGVVTHRALDAAQATVLAAEAQRAVLALTARLGSVYAPQAALALALRPDVVAELPPWPRRTSRTARSRSSPRPRCSWRAARGRTGRGPWSRTRSRTSCSSSAATGPSC